MSIRILAPILAVASLAATAVAQPQRDDLPPAGPLAPDSQIAAGYDGAARALAIADDNPIIRWAYKTWCVTGYRTVGEAGAGQVVDKPLDRDGDMLSQLGYVDPRDDRVMPEGGVRFLDNAWYFGTDLTGMVVVKTDAGLILFDALTNADDMQSQGIDQMKAAGLDPTDIRYIFIGHEHGDHYGGVNLILDRYAPKAKIVATDVAADAIFKAREGIENGTIKPRLFGASAAGLTPDEIKDRALATYPKRIDVRVRKFEGAPVGLQTFTLGTSEVIAMAAPGHTLGQLNSIVSVTAAGKPTKLLIWSGNDSFERAGTYAASTDFVRAVAMGQHVSAFINTHAYQGAVFSQLRRLKAEPSAPNPMIMGEDGVQRYLGVFSECQRAQQRRAQDGTWKAL